ncbi:MAG: TOBE domain-containing protein [Candidatus Neomarinimicrobiota bacterium]
MDVYIDPENMFVGSFIGSPAMNFIEGQIDNRMFRSAGVEIDISDLEYLDDNYPTIILGVRPEDIQIGGGPTMAELIVAEPLGNETILHLQIGKSTVVARVTASINEKPGARLPVKLAPEKILFFNKDSKKRIK